MTSYTVRTNVEFDFHLSKFLFCKIRAFVIRLEERGMLANSLPNRIFIWEKDIGIFIKYVFQARCPILLKTDIVDLKNLILNFSNECHVNIVLHVSMLVRALPILLGDWKIRQLRTRIQSPLHWCKVSCQLLWSRLVNRTNELLW